MTKIRYIPKSEKVGLKEIVEVSRGTASYYFFRPTPFLKDGYTLEIDKEMEKKGWNCGMGGLTYKEKIPIERIISCMAYSRAYTEVYKALTGSKPFEDVPLTVSKFLSMVGAKVNSKKNFLKGYFYRQDINLNSLDSFLRNNGFLAKKRNLIQS